MTSTATASTTIPASNSGEVEDMPLQLASMEGENRNCLEEDTDSNDNTNTEFDEDNAGGWQPPDQETADYTDSDVEAIEQVEEELKEENTANNVEENLAALSTCSLGGGSSVQEDDELLEGNEPVADMNDNPSSTYLDMMDSFNNSSFSDPNLDIWALVAHQQQKWKQSATNSNNNNNTQLLILTALYGQALNREAHPQLTRTLTMIKGNLPKDMSFTLLDASDPENLEQRDRLLELSQIGPVYPQFFLLKKTDHNNNPTLDLSSIHRDNITFFGDYHDFFTANEHGILRQAFVHKQPLVQSTVDEEVVRDGTITIESQELQDVVDIDAIGNGPEINDSTAVAEMSEPHVQFSVDEAEFFSDNKQDEIIKQETNSLENNVTEDASNVVDDELVVESLESEPTVEPSEPILPVPVSPINEGTPLVEEASSNAPFLDNSGNIQDNSVQFDTDFRAAIESCPEPENVVYASEVDNPEAAAEQVVDLAVNPAEPIMVTEEPIPDVAMTAAAFSTDLSFTKTEILAKNSTAATSTSTASGNSSSDPSFLLEQLTADQERQQRRLSETQSKTQSTTTKKEKRVDPNALDEWPTKKIGPLRIEVPEWIDEAFCWSEQNPLVRTEMYASTEIDPSKGYSKTTTSVTLILKNGEQETQSKTAIKNL